MAGKITDLAANSAAATGDLIETVDVSDTSMAATGTNKKITLADFVTWLLANGVGGGSTGYKVTELTAIVGASLATGDLVEVVDISDTTMAASGTNKKTTLADLITFANANGGNTLGPDGDKGDVVVGGTGTTLTFDSAVVTAAAKTVLDDTTVAAMLTTLGGAPVRRTIKADTTTAYAPIVGDENQMVTLSNAGAITVTVPSNATQAFPIGAEVDFLWLGVGQPTFAAGGGATVVSTPGLKLRARYSAATAKKIATNDWVIIGDLSA